MLIAVLVAYWKRFIRPLVLKPESYHKDLRCTVRVDFRQGRVCHQLHRIYPLIFVICACINWMIWCFPRSVSHHSLYKREVTTHKRASPIVIQACLFLSHYSHVSVCLVNSFSFLIFSSWFLFSKSFNFAGVAYSRSRRLLKAIHTSISAQARVLSQGLKVYCKSRFPTGSGMSPTASHIPLDFRHLRLYQLNDQMFSALRIAPLTFAASTSNTQATSAIVGQG